METDSKGINRAPEPEGPVPISERVQRAREGSFGRLKRAFWRVVGLENYTPGKRRLILLVGVVEIGLLITSFFTELPSSWVIAAALGIMPLILHREKKEEDASDTE